MIRIASFCIVAFAALASPSFGQGPKGEVQPTKQWSGSVANANLAAGAPTVIGTAKEFASLWKNWGLAGAAPAVDFAKELVVVQTSRGSSISLLLRLEDGNLAVAGIATRDLRPGFRYVIASVSREGIKTVDGKALPEAK